MSRKYDRSTSKVKNVAYNKIRPEKELVSGFFVVSVVGLWKKAYHEALRSWVSLREGTRYPSYEMAYAKITALRDVEIGNFVVMSLEEVENEY